jgi:lysyl-tRNA synthetase class 1
VEIKNLRDRFNAKRLFEFIHMLKPPAKPSMHIPYDAMVEIAKILPEKNQLKFAMGKLEEFGYKADKKEIVRRLEYAKNWNADFVKPEVTEVKLNSKEKSAVKELIDTIKKEKDGEILQTKIFNIAKSNGIKPKKFFKLTYQLLLNSNRGPRLGPYIIDRGKTEVIKKLKEAL